MFAGMLAVLLPAIREKYGFSLMLGVILLSTQSLACNGVQMLVGHLRSHQKRPLFVPLGLFIATLLCLIGVLPLNSQTIFWIFLLTIVSGVGIAIFHPEGLRAIHNLRAIPSTTASAVFLMAGFFGISGGAWLATLLVSRWGFSGLLVLAPLPFVLILLIKFLGVQLANEDDVRNDKAKGAFNHISIWLLYAMTLPTSAATTIIMSLLPTRLNELGYELTYGGSTNMMIGFGGIVGSLAIAQLAVRNRELFFATLSLCFAAPLFLLYLYFIKHTFAIGLMLPYGFFAVAPYPLIVSMARYVRGYSLGFRMGLIVGGIWGASHLILMALSPIAENFGVQTILNVVWLGYLVSALVGFMLYRKNFRFAAIQAAEPSPKERQSVCLSDTMIAEEQELK